jgi:hypothetical protein
MTFKPEGKDDPSSRRDEISMGAAAELVFLRSENILLARSAVKKKK